jgi:hypothetical protein
MACNANVTPLSVKEESAQTNWKKNIPTTTRLWSTAPHILLCALRLLLGLRLQQATRNQQEWQFV